MDIKMASNNKVIKCGNDKRIKIFQQKTVLESET